MGRTTSAIIYLAGLALAEFLRIGHRIARARNRQDWSGSRNKPLPSEFITLAFVILGIWILPGVYTFTDWLQPLDYQLPAWTAAPGLLIFILSLAIRTAAQLRLAEFWSCTVEISREHQLVQDGIYHFTRHPIYLSLILWGAAQSILLQNYLAGLVCWIPVLLIWLVRVPREEALMLETFGDQYQAYMNRTGRFFPRLTPR